ncbi:MAG: 30S ribosome-binding factor RbfA [Caldilineaceae bacterium]
MSNSYRQQRMASLLLEELRIIVSSELEDPAFAMVDVTDVVVSKDLRNVKAFVSYQEDDVPRKAILQRLEKATPFIRSRIAERLTLRAVPELLFFYDDTPEKASRLDEIFKQIASQREQ